MTSVPTVQIDPRALEQLTARVFEAVGTPADIADELAVSLVEANLTGHDSHGVLRIPQYLDSIADGDVLPTARASVSTDGGAIALVSGEWGFGQLTARLAADEAIQRARRFGVSAVGLVRCNHLGRLGRFVERAAAGGCAAVMWVGGLEAMHQAVPFGGARTAFGANPIAAGFPTGDASSVTVDFATTAVAGGKVLVAHAAGEQMPPGSIVDRHGHPTTSPAAFIHGGALLPFGGHKGYGLAVIAELFGQALTGSDETGDEGPGGLVFRRSGATMIAIDVGAFRPAADATRAARATAKRLRAIPPAPGHERVLAPGDPESAARREREANGIPLPLETWHQIVKAAEAVGVAAPAVNG